MVDNAFRPAKKDKRLLCSVVKRCRVVDIKFTHICPGGCHNGQMALLSPSNTITAATDMREKAIASTCALF